MCRAVFVFVLVLGSVELSVQLPNRGSGQGIPHKLNHLLTTIKNVAGSVERIEPLLDEKLDALKDSISNGITSTLNDSFSDFTSAFSAKLRQCCVPKTPKSGTLTTSVSTSSSTTTGPSSHGAPITGSDCADLHRQGITKDAVYTVTPKQSDPFDVYCDMTTDGGGWTVFQKQFNGSVDFYLNWAAYKTGFGDLRGEFWLGNDKIHNLTTQKEYELRVDLQDVNDVSKYAVYNSFNISSETDNYRLNLGPYKNGTVGLRDSLRIHNGMAFSTKDRDNDSDPQRHCADFNAGAWWYQDCALSNPARKGPNRHFSGLLDGLKRSEMKIRPVDFKTM